MPRRPTRAQIDEADRRELKRRLDFRIAADAVAAALARFAEVQAIALFGSVAAPPRREVPRFREFREHGIEIWRECKDVDLAVWIDRLDGLGAMSRARNQAVSRLFTERGVGVAHHQVDTFLFEPASDRYLGRLCGYATCPKGVRDCLAPGCGREPFLKQHVDFAFDARALAPDHAVRLFERGAGRLCLAEGLPDGVDAKEPKA